MVFISDASPLKKNVFLSEYKCQVCVCVCVSCWCQAAKNASSWCHRSKDVCHCHFLCLWCQFTHILFYTGKKTAFKQAHITHQDKNPSWKSPVVWPFKFTPSPLDVLWPHSSPQRSWQRVNVSAGGRSADQEGCSNDGCLSSAVNGLCSLSQRLNIYCSCASECTCVWLGSCVLSVPGGQEVHSSESIGPLFVFRKCERVPRTWTS